MAETLLIESRDDFIEVCGEQDENPLSEVSRGALYDIWEDYREENPDAHVVLVPEWFSEKEFDIRRPFLFVDIEHDDSSSGAILFSSTQMVDISIPENDAYEFVPLEDTLDVLDISEDDDYIDDAGKVWIPRSLMTIFEHA